MSSVLAGLERNFYPNRLDVAFVRAFFHSLDSRVDICIDAVMDNGSAVADLDNNLVVAPDSHFMSFPRVFQHHQYSTNR